MQTQWVFKVVSNGHVQTQVLQWALPAQGGTIGRAPECDWVLDDPQRLVSRQHARVQWQGGQCLWTDLGTNSTLVNGKPMPQGQVVPLRVGDQLKLAEFLIEIEPAPAHWNDLDALMPVQQEDPLMSLAPASPPVLDIDQLLAGLEPAPVSPVIEDEATPVLAQRMYVGQQGTPAQSPDYARGNSGASSSAEADRLAALLTVSVQGLMQLLQARRIFKEELGGSLTSISGKGNNPLKFAAPIDEVLARLLADGNPGYLSGEEAIAQASKDLLEHMHLSVTRIQALVEQVQSNLDPKAIEREAEQSGAFGIALANSRKARCWDLYCQRYQKLSDSWN